MKREINEEKYWKKNEEVTREISKEIKEIKMEINRDMIMKKMEINRKIKWEI